MMRYFPRQKQTLYDWQLLVFYLLALLAGPGLADEFQDQRQAMIEVIEADVHRTSLYLDTEALDDNVLDAMQRVPRHQFVPPEWQDKAYENRPLPIGHGQTISQPYMVAVMTDLLKPEKGQRVLEIGTGSGYQAAVLAELTANVFTMEIIEPLGIQARERLQRLGYQNVEVRIGDGYYGWEEQAPFDAIVVTAAASQIPPPLVKQLKPGGRMIIPVGSPFMVQQLVLVEKDLQGTLSVRQILPVRFVPLTGSHDE
ncbi:MAG: protein-L-isoaspartate(D-aspartate) O-methyltransferase [Proteobacteria bacterium]|jgi:protein-L-isoaspartate(D-aspartate) O-methyltransferase|nr:protein-L-isoaspartate(D-aspartate) O-methyltransferase [Pseudomonadota bacterium]MCG6936291.1 protein-L-isoaspartate(D-aspartate) O-methyltransferase [Pseudomonadota bacterium]